ncbi:MAG: metal-dependent hydrolase [Rhodopirellula sp. TMED11]|nr:MAG: metal-dependent hydrolase [Rhodopirellula sp. TMED11]
MVKLTWLSHASWLIESGSQRLLLDPFFTDNPVATVQPDAFENVTDVLVSHGHFDHVADAAAILKRSGARLISNFEIVQWFAEKHQLTNALAMNLGGAAELAEGEIKMVPALHSSGLPDGSYGGTAAGFVLKLENKRIYFACDTAYFGDMRFYAGGVDVAVLPIGDLFTMGPADSVEAIKLIGPKIALPTHYGTWPPIEQDAEAWATMVRGETDTKAIVLEVGGSYSL